MGSVSHFAIIITSFVEEDLAKAHAALKAIAVAQCVERYGGDYSEMDVTPIFNSHTEGFASFMVLPTGSKYDGPECRQPFVDKLRELVEGDQTVHDDYTKGHVDDGGLCLDWVFVAYGVDHGKAKVLADCMEEDK